MPGYASWLVSLLIALVVSGVLGWLARDSGRGGRRGVVGYGSRPKVFVLAITAAVSLFLVVFAARPRGPRDREELPYVVLLFSLLQGLLLREVFGRRLTFDEDGVRVSSWWRTRVMRWADVRSVRWRPITRTLYVRDGTSVIRLSTMFAGLDAFAEACIARVRPEAVAGREAAAALLLMRMGKASLLNVSDQPPSKLLAGLSE